ncbi:cytochrome P450 [Pseudonocardia ailaonensis]|uniref:Cytochrome P450 n=1 Tax=Pseudonocardia ailaonensis TaxID=367279 RepID=A0ABN2NJG7_9PSEU
MTSHIDPVSREFDVDHHSEEFWESAPETFAMLREKCPVAHSSQHGGFWMLTTYDTVAEAARDDDRFSSYRDLDGSRPGYDGVSLPPSRRPTRTGMIELDPPEFTKYRRLLNASFSPQAVERLRPRILEITTAVLDVVIERGECELVKDVAGPITAAVTMDQLGIPADRGMRYSNTMHDLLSISPTSPGQAAAVAQVEELLGELREQVRLRRAAPQDDWISLLVTAEVDGAPIPDDIVVENAFLLVLGGVDTTSQLILHSLRYLHQNPELREDLREHPERLRNACEEFLRYFSPIQWFARTVTRDCEVDGVDLKAGERVLLCWGSGNHDAAHFEDPEVVNIDRSPNRHMAFGVGVHRCIGSHLARAQFEIVVGEILRRMPDYSVDEGETRPYPDRQVNGLVRMPASFTPGSREALVATEAGSA